jgi:hypothetical protein
VRHVAGPANKEPKRGRGSQESAVTNGELALFCRQFGSLMHAKVNLLDILKALREQSDNPMMREVVDSVRDDVEMGRSMATAFGRYPTIFSPFFISMVRQGELEGELDRIFNDLADHFETRLGTNVDTSKRRDQGSVDLEGLASTALWLFSWIFALTAVCLLAGAITWYATEMHAVPGAIVPNIMIVVAVILMVGVLAIAAGRRR